MQKKIEFDETDVVIVGGGPAGLSAALILGRCCRNVLIIDAKEPRNYASKNVWGFLTCDGVSPRDIRNMARLELKRYPNVRWESAEVTDIRKKKEVFEVEIDHNMSTFCRKILLATGLIDELPKIANMQEFFGKTVFQCPYCDGWEFRDQPVAAYGKGRKGFEMARALSAWSKDVVLCTNGSEDLSKDELKVLSRNKIDVLTKPITALCGMNGILQSIHFADGTRIRRNALFFDTESFQRSSLPTILGCAFTKAGGIRADRNKATSVEGVYAAGNIIKDVHLAVAAAAEGAKAAIGINKSLTREDFSASEIYSQNSHEKVALYQS